MGISILSFLIALISIVFGWLLHRNRRTVAELAEEQRQVSEIFDHFRDAVLVLDRKLNIVRVNRAATHLLGVPARPMPSVEVLHTFEVYLPNGVLVPPDDWPIARALRGDFSKDIELKVRRTDTGATILAEISTAPLANRAGEVTHFLVAHRDVTHPKQINEARMRLAAIVESSEDAIIGKDNEGTVLSWNRGAENIFGYKAEEIVGSSIRLLIPEDRLEEEDEILRRIQLGETVEHIETLRERKNGQIIHVSLTVSPIHDSTGSVVGASKIARNITERKQLERQLNQSQKMEAIGQLTGGIAHDFNNLLAVIIGNLDLLERAEQGNEPGLKRIRTAQKAALRGADLTKRLLVFSSSGESKPVLIDLNRSVHNVLELASRVLGSDIKTVTRLEKDLPPIFVDASNLENALLNLVLNARDAMTHGGTLTLSTQLHTLEDRGLRVQLAELKPGRYACLSVSDSGHGMPREVLDRVFEPFFTTKPRGKGTGLGLSLAYAFCKQSNGTARIYSELELGTTVSFYLPIAKNVIFPELVIPKMTPKNRTGTISR